MSGISFIKYLVDTQLLTQYNNIICKETPFYNAKEILVKYISNNSPSGGLDNDYWLDTSNSKLILKIKRPTGWEIIYPPEGELSYMYIIRYPDYNTFYNVYNNTINGELMYINPILGLYLRTSSKIYRYYLSLNPLSSGRYLSTNILPAEQVCDIALGVTDGTYTNPIFTNGQILTTNITTYSLINGIWTRLN